MKWYRAFKKGDALTTVLVAGTCDTKDAPMSRPERQSILDSLRAKIRDGRPIVGGGAGTGLSAKCEEAGGIDLIVIYNSGRYRMAGRGSLAGLLAYGGLEKVFGRPEAIGLVKRDGESGGPTVPARRGGDGIIDPAGCQEARGKNQKEGHDAFDEMEPGSDVHGYIPLLSFRSRAGRAACRDDGLDPEREALALVRRRQDGTL